MERYKRKKYKKYLMRRKKTLKLLNNIDKPSIN